VALGGPRRAILFHPSPDLFQRITRCSEVFDSRAVSVVRARPFMESFDGLSLLNRDRGRHPSHPNTRPFAVREFDARDLEGLLYPGQRISPSAAQTLFVSLNAIL
jgi:hypothetical protein